MPIVNHTFESSLQPDGRISYILRMYDQDAVERMQVGLLPADFDTAAFVALKIIAADEQLATDEFNSLIG